MSWWPWRRDREQDLQEEIAAHIGMAIADRMARGETPEEAEAAVLREFGNRLLSTESVRRQWRWTFPESLAQDVRFGCRVLRAAPAVAGLAVLALSLGIGATTVMFSVFYGVLLDPFPYPDGNRLVMLSVFDLDQSAEAGRRWTLSPQERRAFEGGASLFEGFVACETRNGLLEQSGNPRWIRLAVVSPNTFEFIGIPPKLGRVIQTRDGGPDAEPVAVLSEPAWRKYFGADPAVVGRVITLDRRRRTIVGVAPKRYAWWTADIWIPQQGPAPNGMEFSVQARLKPGVRIEQANEQLTAIGARLQAIYPERYPKRFRVRGVYCIDDIVHTPFRRTLYTLLGAVGLLLLIACSNVANMLLSRATVRRREIGVRMALGAGRWRILRQLLIESLLLALLSVAGGIAMAWGGIQLLQAILPPNTIAEESVVNLNPSVLLFSLGVSAFTVMLFGVAPAWQLARGQWRAHRSSPGRPLCAVEQWRAHRSPPGRPLCAVEHWAEALHGNAKGSAGGDGGAWIRDLLVVTQVGMSLVLLIGAGLMARSFTRSLGIDLQVNPRSVAVALPEFPPNSESAPGQRESVLENYVHRLRLLPRVIAAARTTEIPAPFVWNRMLPLEIAGPRGRSNIQATFHAADWGARDTFGYRLLAGHWFTEEDVTRLRRVAVVNNSLARAMGGAAEAMGRPIRLPRGSVKDLAGHPVDVLEIVGVMADLPNRGLRQTPLPMVEAPSTVAPRDGQWIALRVAGDADSMIPAMERAMVNTAPGVFFYWIDSLAASLEQDLAPQRFALWLLGVFATIGATLLVIGLYGVMSYAVARRTYELGVRMALGAEASSVLRLIVSRGLALVAAGVGLGLLAALLLSRLLATQLGDLSPYDPPAWLAAGALLLATTLGAILIPGARALRISPAQTLRHE